LPVAFVQAKLAADEAPASRPLSKIVTLAPTFAHS
jgi:hypothetical protein